MAKVAWSASAARDLERAVAYIAQDSPAYAAAFAREVLAASRSLRSLAGRGRIVPEVGRDDVRELILGSYRLIYRTDQAPSRVRVLAFLHGRRELRMARLPLDEPE